MQSVIPQESILGPFLYTVHTADIPITTKTTFSAYADETAITTTHPNPTNASRCLQAILQKIELWMRKWRLKINETKFAHITFTRRKGSCPPLHINQNIMPQTDTVKYFGLHFDKRLTWREDVTKTRKHLDLKTRELLWLIGKRSPLSQTNKQTPNIQNGIKTNLDLRIGIMGLCRIIQPSQNPEVLSEDPSTNHQRSMVCNKSYLTQRSEYPANPNGPSATNRYSSYNTTISPQTPHGTCPQPARQQAIA